MTDGPLVLLVAGEASGDLRGAELAAELRERVPNLRLVGVGGERLRAAGMRTLVDAESLSTMGLTEVVGRLRSVLGAYRRVREAIRRGLDGGRRPDLVILIDLPDFNLRLARVAQRAGIPVLYYVSPQVWAWRRYRVRTLARRVDRLAVVFPFEEELYRGLTDVTFVGHPAVETVRATRSREEWRRAHGFAPESALVAILPGSRRAEVASLLPAMLDGVARLGPGVQPAIALASESLRAQVEEIARGRAPVIAGETYDLVAAADLALVSSGTATLETALLGTPMVIMYRLSPVTYAVARALVRVEWIGMPNLILGKQAVPELIQSAVSAESIAREAGAILRDPTRAAAIRADLARVREALGGPGAARRTAEIAAEMLSGARAVAARAGLSPPSTSATSARG